MHIKHGNDNVKYVINYQLEVNKPWLMFRWGKQNVFNFMFIHWHLSFN